MVCVVFKGTDSMDSNSVFIYYFIKKKNQKNKSTFHNPHALSTSSQ